MKFIFYLLFKSKYTTLHLAGWGHPILQFFIVFSKLAGITVVIESDTPPYPVIFWKRVIKRVIYPYLFRCANLFLPGGSRQAKYIEYYGVKSERIIPVQMTVDIVSIKKQAITLSDDDRTHFKKRHGIPKGDTVFLYVGRLEVYKGVTDLISAFNNIKLDHTRLLIVGDGSLQSYVTNSTRLNKHIHYIGRFWGKDLIECYYASDALILPSRRESWGLTVNEAMAMNLPVIVSDVVGCIDDLVIHKETGLIIQTQNIENLQHSIEYLAKTPDMRMMMGENAGKKIADWTLENEAKNICQAWDCLKAI